MTIIEITYRDDSPFRVEVENFIDIINDLWECIEAHPDNNAFAIELNDGRLRTKFGMADDRAFGTFDFGDPKIMISFIGKDDPNFSFNIDTFLEFTEMMTLYNNRIKNGEEMYLKISDTRMGYGILDTEKQKLRAN